VRILSDAGLVITDDGKGSFVRPQITLIRLGNDRYSPWHRDTGLSPFLLECAKQGKTGRFEVLSIDRVQPPAEVAERLAVSARAKSVLRRENVFAVPSSSAPGAPLRRSARAVAGRRSWPGSGRGRSRFA
jgi:GntR family transcriptional regulator